MRILRPALLTALALSSTPFSAHAQCPGWSPGFERGGTDDDVRALALYDDGQGERVYAGGWFTSIDGTNAARIARWDGARWEPLSSGPNARVYALSVYDDGQGPGLYAAGLFTMVGSTNAINIARWDGTSWSALGAGVSIGLDVRSLCVFDDGGGPDLYAGGFFTQAGGMPAARIARWDGSSWSALGSGLNNVPDTLAVFDDGNGPALYAGGRFFMAGGVPASRIAKWDGANWSALGAGVNGDVRALVAFDDGSGPALYVGGSFTSAGGQAAPKLARWNGTSWTAMSGQPVQDVSSLAVHTTSEGDRLAVGGAVPAAALGTLPGLALWDGTSWETSGSGMSHTGNDAGEVVALASFDAFGPRELFVGGSFDLVDGMRAVDLASWTEGEWSAFGGDGLSQSGDDFGAEASALHVHDGGAGPELFLTGRFRYAGPAERNSIARWDGVAWQPLAEGLGFRGHALTSFDDGGGSDLIVAGRFGTAGTVDTQSVASWDGASWSGFGEGLTKDLGMGPTPATVIAVAGFDDGGGAALFAGGLIDSSGATPLSNVAEWDGGAWIDVDGGVDALVRALLAFDDGHGPALYVAGDFVTAGSAGVPALRIARWDGATWRDVGGGFNAPVHALFAFDDGTGTALYAGGEFTSAGGQPASRVARWDGASWTPLGGGTSGPVLALSSFDDGSGTGELLHVGGEFAMAGNLTVDRIASWNGANWAALEGGGVVGSVYALASFDDGAGGGADLYLGGYLVKSGGIPCQHVAQWRGCAEPGIAYCFGDGSGAACPCDNGGAPGNGCANGSFAQGARLASSGAASVSNDTLMLTSTQATPSQPGLFFQGDNAIAGGTGIPFGDGLRCAGGAVVRLEVRVADGAGAANTTIPISTAGQVAAGETRRYQHWYRDPALSPCGATFNLTNGVEVAWTP